MNPISLKNRGPNVKHASKLTLIMGVNGEALQLHAVYKKPYLLLQVTRESVCSTASHAMQVRRSIII